LIRIVRDLGARISIHWRRDASVNRRFVASIDPLKNNAFVDSTACRQLAAEALNVFDAQVAEETQ
jgi:hypothetical protein